MSRATAGLLAALALLTAGLAQAQQQDITLREAAYRAGKARIAVRYKLDMASCAQMAADAKTRCVEDARASRVAARGDLQADLEFAPRSYAVAAQPAVLTRVSATPRASVPVAHAAPGPMVLAVASVSPRGQSGGAQAAGLMRAVSVLPPKAKFGEN